MSIAAELPTRRNEAWKYSDLRQAVGDERHVLRQGRDIIERLAPGTQTLAAAQRLGIPVPRTEQPRSMADIEALLAEL